MDDVKDRGRESGCRNGMKSLRIGGVGGLGAGREVGSDAELLYTCGKILGDIPTLRVRRFSTGGLTFIAMNLSTRY